MGSGTLRFEIKTANGDLPVSGADIRITDSTGATLYRENTDSGGLAKAAKLSAPDNSLTLDPAYTGPVFGSYNVQVNAEGFRTVNIEGVQIFDGVDSILPVILHPLSAGAAKSAPQTITIMPNALKDPTPRHQVTEPPNPRVLREVIIPDFIRVKLGRPDSDALVERVPFIYYIKEAQ